LAIIGFFCLVAYSLTSLVVGGRLVLRSRASRGLPEFLMGIAHFTAPGLGYPIVVLCRLLPERGDQMLAFGIGQGLIVFGCTCFLFFNATVFRPRSGAALAFAAFGSLVLAYGGCAAYWGLSSTTDAALAAARASGGTAATLAALGAGYAWTSFEGLRYRAMMRRREALGLGEPLVANRFLLWAIAGLASMAYNVICAAYLIAGFDISTQPVPVLATSLGGLVGAVLLVFIFMPPAWYVRWILRSAPRGALAVA